MGCNVEDILCQLETLRHLRGLQREMGKDAFRERFPELAGIEDKLTGNIGSQEESLSEALKQCQDELAPAPVIETEVPEDLE